MTAPAKIDSPLVSHLWNTAADLAVVPSNSAFDFLPEDLRKECGIVGRKLRSELMLVRFKQTVGGKTP